MPLREWLKVQAALPALPDLKRRIALLEKALAHAQGKATERHEPADDTA